MAKFNVQSLANTAWAFAMAGQNDIDLFAGLTTATERRMCDFNPQNLANTSWAFATLCHVDAQLFMALGR